MSRASKITLGFSIALTFVSTIGVYYMAENEKDALKMGPIKDAERLARRKINTEESNESQPISLSSKQKANLQEFELQKKLQEQLSLQQPLTGEIVTAEPKKNE